MMGFKRFKRCVATKVTPADAKRQKIGIGIKRWVETKVTSADAASSTSTDAARYSPSAVLPPLFNAEILVVE